MRTAAVTDLTNLRAQATGSSLTLRAATEQWRDSAIDEATTLPTRLQARAYRWLCERGADCRAAPAKLRDAVTARVTDKISAWEAQLRDRLDASRRARYQLRRQLRSRRDRS